MTRIAVAVNVQSENTRTPYQRHHIKVKTTQALAFNLLTQPNPLKHLHIRQQVRQARVFF